MAIKRINDTLPGVERPFRLQDIQDVWTGLQQTLALGGDTRIVCGFNINVNGTLSSGVLSYDNRLWVYDTDNTGVIRINDNLYISEISSEDMRVFKDGSTQIFSYNMVVTNSTGIQIGQATQQNLNIWKTPFIGQNMITTALLANGCVTSLKLGASAVQTDHILTNAVTYDKLATDITKCVVTGSSDVILTNELTEYTISDFLVFNNNGWESRVLNVKNESTNSKTLVIELGVNNVNSLRNFPQIMPMVIKSGDEGDVQVLVKGSLTTQNDITFDEETLSHMTGVRTWMLSKTAYGYIPMGEKVTPIGATN